MSNGLLHARTIHFAFAHIIPFEQLSGTNIREIENNLEDKSIQILGNNFQDDRSLQVKCKSSDGTVFTLKFVRVGQVGGGAPEPVYAIVVKVGDEGYYNTLGKIYNLCLEAINTILELPKLVIAKEATIKTLYGVIKDMPSFQFLWEKVLNQTVEKIKHFGTPIGGGGLRVVVAPRPIPELNNEVVISEFKIESFLQDPRYLFTEIKYNWQIPVEYKEKENLIETVKLSTEFVLNDSKNVIDNFLKGVT